MVALLWGSIVTTTLSVELHIPEVTVNVYVCVLFAVYVGVRVVVFVRFVAGVQANVSFPVFELVNEPFKFKVCP
jgi:hypothetical protein